MYRNYREYRAFCPEINPSNARDTAYSAFLGSFHMVFKRACPNGQQGRAWESITREGQYVPRKKDKTMGTDSMGEKKKRWVGRSHHGV